MPLTRRPASEPGLRSCSTLRNAPPGRGWLPLGCFYGVTTNPVLLQHAKIPCVLPELSSLVRDALALGAGEVQVQTWGRTRALYFEHGQALAALSPRVVVKVPTTVEGVAAASMLAREGVRLRHDRRLHGLPGAGGACARRCYAAPYLGRMNDAGRDGFGEIAAMARTARDQGAVTRILVASLRHTGDVVPASRRMASTSSAFSPSLAAGLFTDETTAETVEAFEMAAQPQ